MNEGPSRKPGRALARSGRVVTTSMGSLSVDKAVALAIDPASTVPDQRLLGKATVAMVVAGASAGQVNVALAWRIWQAMQAARRRGG